MPFSNDGTSKREAPYFLEAHVCLTSPIGSWSCTRWVFAREPNNSDVQALQRVELLCCPEDHHCQYGCEKDRRLCHGCELPICIDCRLCLQANQVVPVGLMNDNWYGYVERFIYDQKVTWVEKIVSTPFWTGLKLMEIDVRRGQNSVRRRHKLHDPLFSGEGRIAYKGQLFSAPMKRT